jgi:hypothetical protein
VPDPVLTPLCALTHNRAEGTKSKQKCMLQETKFKAHYWKKKKKIYIYIYIAYMGSWLLTRHVSVSFPA